MLGFFATPTILSVLKRVVLWLLHRAVETWRANATRLPVPPASPPPPTLNPALTVRAGDAAITAVEAEATQADIAQLSKITAELTEKTAAINNADLPELAAEMNKVYPVPSRLPKP